MKYSLLAVGLFMVFFSCKNEEKNEGVEVVNAPEINPKDLFKISMDLVVKKDDSLQLFYKEAGMVDYEEMKSVWAPVKGSEDPQTVSFNLPKDVLPSQLRVDFGTNKVQEPIQVKNFSMNYLDKTFQAKDTMFFQYFIPNQQIDWDRKNAVAKFNIKAGEFHDPGFSSRETLDAELQKIVK